MRVSCGLNHSKAYPKGCITNRETASHRVIDIAYNLYGSSLMTLELRHPLALLTMPLIRMTKYRLLGCSS